MTEPTNTNYTCKICGNNVNNKIFTAEEMMFGLKDSFEYFECYECKCIQIAEIPNNISKYYPSTYYSLNAKEITDNPVLKILKKIIGFIVINIKNIRIPYIVLKKLKLTFLQIIKETNVDFYSSILDVGSGNGEKLNILASAGFKNLQGIDPFLNEDINYDNGVKLYKKDIFKTENVFDMIMLNHSFEHMENPENILGQINKLLKPNSIALIRIPVSDSFAWKKYGKNWVNLDPPRHLFLHNYNTISLLANKTNFVIEKVIYDSDECQFWVSEQYAKGIPMYDKKSYYKGNKTLFNSKQIKLYKLQAEKLNQEGLGDKACFYLKKI